MFESALEQGIPRRQLGRGAMVSMVTHAVLIGLALYLSSRPTHAQKNIPELRFFNFPPPPLPPPPPAGGGSKANKVEPKKVIKKPDAVVETKNIEKSQERPPDPAPETPEPGGQPNGVPGGQPNGVPNGQIGGDPNGKPNGVPGGQSDGMGNGNEVIPFGAGMQKPTMIHAPEITFSKEGLAMRIGGVALVECVLNLDESVSDCRIKQGLQYMEPEILQAARTMRFTPVIYQGHPQRVKMTIPIRVKAPN